MCSCDAEANLLLFSGLGGIFEDGLILLTDILATPLALVETPPADVIELLCLWAPTFLITEIEFCDVLLLFLLLLVWRLRT